MLASDAIQKVEMFVSHLPAKMHSGLADSCVDQVRLVNDRRYLETI
jgi:hypothetical protein